MLFKSQGSTLLLLLLFLLLFFIPDYQLCLVPVWMHSWAVDKNLQGPPAV